MSGNSSMRETGRAEMQWKLVGTQLPRAEAEGQPSCEGFVHPFIGSSGAMGQPPSRTETGYTDRKTVAGYR